MAKVLRGLVSKQKKRFSEDGFDLDLSYITPQLIAMGYPTEGREAAYRNPYKQVYQFLEKRHKGNYRVYNLCSEKNRQYEASKFHDQVACFPFEDHHPPPFDLMEKFCKDVLEYLSESDQHVAAIHCKAGKGRTGTMIISYLLYSHFYSDPDHAKRYYAAMRTYNRKGLTIPSQSRYVDYFYSSLRDRSLVEKPVAPTLILTSIKIVPPPIVEKLDLLRLVVFCNRKMVYENDIQGQMSADISKDAKRAGAVSSQLSRDSKSKKEPKKDKKKSTECASCKKVFPTKANVWVICSMCGRDTCTDCTKKHSLNLDGEIHRLICGSCVAKKMSSEDMLKVILTYEQDFFANRDSVVNVDASENLAITFKLEQPLALSGDVKICIMHRGTKPLVHCWLNTRFHKNFPIVLKKQQIDGSDKDPKNKKFPLNFHMVIDMRPGEAGEKAAVESVLSTGKSMSRLNATASGFTVDQKDSIVCFNSDPFVGSVDPSVCCNLMKSALQVVFKHSISSKDDGFIFTIDSAAAMASDFDYNALLGRLNALSAVEFESDASICDKLAFWLNAYHLLLIISAVECFPNTPKDRAKNGRTCAFVICGEKYTLAQIEFGILRPSCDGSQHNPLSSGVTKNPKYDFGELSPIITFAISYACRGTPAILAYEGPSLKETIRQNCGDYLKRYGLTLNEKKTSILVSNYLEWCLSEAESSEVEQSVVQWVKFAGDRYADGASILHDMKNLKFKFEENVFLDEYVFYLGKNMGESDGVHFSSPKKGSKISKDKGEMK